MKVSTVFDLFPLIHLFLPRTYPRQNLINARHFFFLPAKFNLARSGVIVQCLGRNRPSTTPPQAILFYKKYPYKQLEKLY